MGRHGRLAARALVIGGGPSGATAARTLGRAGMDTILLERDPDRTKPCGGAVPSVLFDEYAIPRSLIRQKTSAIKIVSPSGKTAGLELEDSPICIVNRGEFDRELRDHAVEAGAQLMVGEFLSFSRKGKGIVSDIKTRDGDVSIDSEFVIACDGVNSRTRPAHKKGHAIYTASARTSAMHTDACEFWLSQAHSPGSYSWVFPSPDGGVSFGTGALHGHRLKDCLDEFASRRGIGPPETMRAYRLPVWGKRASPLADGNILFAGDCAGHVMPLTFEGIYYAMRSGAMAAEAALKSAPASYRQQWEREFGMTFKLMSRLGEHFLRGDAEMERFVDMFDRSVVRTFARGVWGKKRMRGIGRYMAALRGILG